jgi:hypothetical protein
VNLDQKQKPMKNQEYLLNHLLMEEMKGIVKTQKSYQKERNFNKDKSKRNLFDIDETRQ